MDPRTEAVRQGLRDTASIERKYHRNISLNKNRPILGEIIDESYTEEFIRSKARVLKKKPLRIKEFQHLQNAFLQSENNINVFLSVDNVLNSLVRELSGKNPDIQLAAANCCCNIALGNNKACTALAKATVPYLLASLDSLNYNLMDICIWTIGNLAAGSEKAFEIIYAQGCLRRLVSLMEECDLALLPSVAYATMHCAHVGFRHMEDSEMMNVTQAVVNRQTHHHDANMIWLLAILSSRKACLEHISMILPSIVEYLHIAAASDFTDVVQATGSVRIMANLVSDESGEAADNFLNNPKYDEDDIKLVLDKFLRHEHLHLRKETLWFIGNLYNHPSSQHREKARALISGLSSLELAAKSVGAFV